MLVGKKYFVKNVMKSCQYYNARMKTLALMKVAVYQDKNGLSALGKRIFSITLDHEHRPIPILGLLWFTRHNEIDVVIKK